MVVWNLNNWSLSQRLCGCVIQGCAGTLYERIRGQIVRSIFECTQLHNLMQRFNPVGPVLLKVLSQALEGLFPSSLLPMFTTWLCYCIIFNLYKHLFVFDLPTFKVTDQVTVMLHCRTYSFTTTTDRPQFRVHWILWREFTIFITSIHSILFAISYLARHMNEWWNCEGMAHGKYIVFAVFIVQLCTYHCYARLVVGGDFEGGLTPAACPLRGAFALYGELLLRMCTYV